LGTQNTGLKTNKTKKHKTTQKCDESVWWYNVQIKMEVVKYKEHE
jgi:hypothetical protein